MPEALITVLAFLGVFTGIFIRTAMPYFRKARENEGLKFDLKFLWTAVGAALISFPLAAVVFPEFLTSLDPSSGGFVIYITGVAFGYTFNGLLNDSIATKTSEEA